MDLSLEKLKQAVSLREEIETLEARLRSLFGGGSFSGSNISPDGIRRRRPMSEATRAKLAAAARRRWALRDGIGRPRRSDNGTSPVRKGGLSPEGRKKISDAMKARWAAVKQPGNGTAEIAS